MTFGDPEGETSNTKNTDFVREFLFVTSRIQASLIRSVPNKKPRFTRGFFVAERGGFEPPVRRAYNGFRDRPVRPLRHLSREGFTKIYKKPDLPSSGWFNMVACVQRFVHCKSERKIRDGRIYKSP